RDYRCFTGYAGWAPGQLEEEMRHEGWLILPASYDDIFKTSPEKMWKQITARHGIDISSFSERTGYA
ncbi:MAG: YqgE/AlgH family protein, partial [Thermodesulfobacteriota bacterium]